MIKTNSDDIRYRVRFTNGAHTASSDTTQDKGGSGSGFRPHDLLEAALASCINMTLRMVADQHALPLSGVTTRVTLDRTDPEEVVFEYKIDLHGSLSREDPDRFLKWPRDALWAKRFPNGSDSTRDETRLPRKRRECAKMWQKLGYAPYRSLPAQALRSDENCENLNRMIK